jgi:phage terminase large subunit
MFIVDEHAERLWLPEQHARAINELLGRHNVATREPVRKDRVIAGINFGKQPAPIGYRYLVRFNAGTDVFSRQSDGYTIAQHYINQGLRMTPANVDRINGWAEILTRLGDPDRGIAPRLFIHKRCTRLITCLPSLQHDPNRPEDILKVNVDDEGLGGDDAADALRYLVATKPRQILERKLVGV